MSKPKTIAYVFNQHQEELFALMNSKNQFPELQKKVDELLDSKELEGNASVPEAKMIFAKKKKQYNNFLSTLMTYMTCMKVS